MLNLQRNLSWRKVNPFCTVLSFELQAPSARAQPYSTSSHALETCFVSNKPTRCLGDLDNKTHISLPSVPGLALIMENSACDGGVVFDISDSTANLTQPAFSGFLVLTSPRALIRPEMLGDCSPSGLYHRLLFHTLTYDSGRQSWILRQGWSDKEVSATFEAMTFSHFAVFDPSSLQVDLLRILLALFV